MKEWGWPGDDPRNVARDERTTRQFVLAAERDATELRCIARITPEARLDPFALAKECEMAVVRADEIELSQEDRVCLSSITPKEWSGGCLRRFLPDGRLLVLLHSGQTPERERVTVMEEVAHYQLGHEAVELPNIPLPGWERGYDPSTEREAYWTAAAALLPSVCVGRAVWQRRPAESLAQEFGVSIELVEFRIKILLLWEQYQSYQG